MYSLATLFGLLLMSKNVASHWQMPILYLNGTETEEYEYVRRVLAPEGWNPAYIWAPIVGYELYDNNFACGRGAFPLVSATKTAYVQAGSEVGFKVNNGNVGGLYHPGPTQIYMTRLLDDQEFPDFSGVGADWFKIASWAQRPDNKEWITYMKLSVNFTIPLTTPPGKYLLRVESSWGSTSPENPQWYINCAQIDLHGPGGGVPTDFARFPGTYNATDPGIVITEAQFEYPYGGSLAGYVAPGPKVWTG